MAAPIAALVARNSRRLETRDLDKDSWKLMAARIGYRPVYEQQKFSGNYSFVETVLPVSIEVAIR